jgi:hypothetical protein
MEQFDVQNKKFWCPYRMNFLGEQITYFLRYKTLLTTEYLWVVFSMNFDQF